MQRPRDLKKAELVAIVGRLQGLLYIDIAGTEGEKDDAGNVIIRPDHEFWNPDKPWEGATVCDEMARILDRHGLVPHELEEL